MKHNIAKQPFSLNREMREARNKHKGKVIWLMGLSGSGKSTLANLLEVKLFQKGHQTYVLDGDNIRYGLNNDLGFSREGREENLRRVAEVCKLMVDAGIIVIASFITPMEEYRNTINDIVGGTEIKLIYIKCPLEVCENRDVKGLYAKARTGKIKNFTGITAPFEEPKNADLILDTSQLSPEECVRKLLTLTLKTTESIL